MKRLNQKVKLYTDVSRNYEIDKDFENFKLLNFSAHSLQRNERLVSVSERRPK